MPPSYDFSLIRKPDHSKARRQFKDLGGSTAKYQTIGAIFDTRKFPCTSLQQWSGGQSSQLGCQEAGCSGIQQVRRELFTKHPFTRDYFMVGHRLLSFVESGGEDVMHDEPTLIEHKESRPCPSMDVSSRSSLAAAL